MVQKGSSRVCYRVESQEFECLPWLCFQKRPLVKIAINRPLVQEEAAEITKELN